MASRMRAERSTYSAIRAGQAATSAAVVKNADSNESSRGAAGGSDAWPNRSTRRREAPRSLTAGAESMQPAARAETKVRSSAFHNVSRFQTNGRAPGGAWGRSEERRVGKEGR